MMADSDTFRCCYCRHENRRTWQTHEMKAGLHKKKTLTTYCERCDGETVQNKLGA